jgi:hypothetical protein
MAASGGGFDARPARECVLTCGLCAAWCRRRQTSDTLAVSLALKPSPDMTHKLAKYLVPQQQVRGLC